MFDFYKTRMGMTFFEGTMPSLVRELKRLNDNLEADRKERAKAHACRFCGRSEGQPIVPNECPQCSPIKDHADGHSEFACPGCGCEPGDGRTDGCTHPDGCGH